MCSSKKKKQKISGWNSRLFKDVMKEMILKMKGVPWDLEENAVVRPKVSRTKTDMVPVALARAPGTPGTPRGAPGTPRGAKASEEVKGPVIALSTPAQDLNKASENMSVDAAVNTALPPTPAGMPQQVASSAAAAADDDWLAYAGRLGKRTTQQEAEVMPTSPVHEPPERKARVAAVEDDEQEEQPDDFDDEWDHPGDLRE